MQRNGQLKRDRHLNTERLVPSGHSAPKHGLTTGPWERGLTYKTFHLADRHTAYQTESTKTDPSLHLEIQSLVA